MWGWLLMSQMLSKTQRELKGTKAQSAEGSVFQVLWQLVNLDTGALEGAEVV